MKLLETWAIDPNLKGENILIVAECLTNLAPQQCAPFFEENRIVLTICPETETESIVYGKLATMMVSSRPAQITVLTTECSRHCSLVHGSVNEALYITGLDIPVRHFVCLYDKEDSEWGTCEISPNAARIARYLHLVEKLIQKNPDILDELRRYSLEYKKALEIKGNL
jgi:hypothetical protein